MSYATTGQLDACAWPVWPAGRAVDVCLAAVPEAELVTNSVEHAGLTAGELVRVGAAVSDGVVRLEADDPGSTGTIAARPDLERGGGFGLWLVDALAHAWGVSREGRTRVWVELVCRPATGALRA
jgi:two-component sensor histidine kinase